MLRKFIEKLDDRCVPSTTPTTTEPTTTTEPSETDVVDTTSDTETDVTTTGTDTETETPDETVQTVGGETTSEPMLPPVTFGEGNFSQLGVGSKYALVSGLRNGEARLYGFSSSGNLVDTGRTFTPFPTLENRQTSVRGAVGDFNNDGVADFAFVHGGGAVTQLRVIDGKSGKDLVATRFAFGEYFQGGANVTVTDIDGDHRDELVVTPDAGGGPRIRIFSITDDGTLISRADFFGIDDLTNRGGIRAAGGDMNGDGKNDLVLTASSNTGARIAVYDGASFAEGQVPTRLISEFAARADEASIASRAGVSVSLGDLNHDGFADLIFGSASGVGSQITALDGKQVLTDIAAAQTTPLSNFAAFVAGYRAGVNVAVKDFDGDGKADLLTSTGAGSLLKVNGYRRQQLTVSASDPAASISLDPFSSVKNASKLSNGVAVG